MTHDRKKLFEKSSKVPSIHALGICALAITLVLAGVAVYTITRVFSVSRHAEVVRANHEECSSAAEELMDASDLLTSESRMFVLTHRTAYLTNYLNEVYDARRRDEALDVIGSHMQDEEAKRLLQKAFDESDELARDELYAMRLAADAAGIDDLPEPIANVELREADAALPPEQKQSLAETLVLNEEYLENKDLIVEDVNACADAVVRHLRSEEQATDDEVAALLTGLRIIVYALAGMLCLITVSYHLFVLRPMKLYSQSIKQDERLASMGTREMRDLAVSYNLMYDENHRKTVQLKHDAMTDGLTDLLNRASFEKILNQDTDDIVLILIDIDKFKDINDTYGHVVGDDVLKKVAASIREQFRTTDYCCRIGGDEMAVVMTSVDNVNEGVVTRKMENVAFELRNTDDGLPVVTLSVGVAFGRLLADETNIYHAADKALYDAKRNGRNRIAFYMP